MNFADNSDYTIVSNNEAASIICRFTPEMIEDTVRSAISTKYNNYSMSLVNIVEALETNYKMSFVGLPEYKGEINSSREDSYRNIMNLICQAHNLKYVLRENDDIYSAAYYTYDLLISQFNVRIINFFVNYINREKNTLYETLELAAKRKDDSPYSKKLYKNGSPKLATIHANLEYVLENICAYDINFNEFLELAYIPDRVKARLLQFILIDCGDFFTRIIVPYFKANYATLVTHIKFALQGLATAELTDLV